MKKLIFLLAATMVFQIAANAQLKKDGTPDMRYNSNKQTYGTYSSPSSNYGTNSSSRYQNGYSKDNGTYVESHYKTNVNTTNWDNYSTKENTNPYTGTDGSRARDYSTDAYNYGKGNNINTGPKGGQYYYNSNGNKTYVPKRY